MQHTITSDSSRIAHHARLLIPALIVCALAVIAGTVVSGCSRGDQPRVVLYVSADDYLARLIVRAFEDQHDIRVDMVGDTEAMKTTGLIERIRAERDNPQADVFWSSEVFYTIQLAEEGLLDEHLSDATIDWPRNFRDGERRWYGFGARARVIVYSPERVSDNDVPQTWMDLTRSRWKDRIVMADPRFGTTGGHLGAIKSYWDRVFGPGIYDAWLLGLAENNVRLHPGGNAAVVEAVVTGEADVGMTDTDDVYVYQQRDGNVELVYARHDVVEDDDGTVIHPPGSGTLLIPNTVMRIKGGPNPDQAGVLIDFLLSEEVERMMAQSVSGNIPINPTIAGDYPDLHVDDPLDVRYEDVARVMPDAIRAAMRILDDSQSNGDAATAGNPADDE